MRCETHALAGGADGRCVLCLRDEGGVAGSGPSGPNVTARVFTVLGVAFALVLGGGSFYRFGLNHAGATSPSAAPIGPTLVDMRAPAATTTSNEAPGANPRDRAADAELARVRRDEEWRSALASVRIVVYTTKWCPSCKSAKAWLRESSIPFEERDIEASAEYDRQMKALGAKAIPTFDIEGDVKTGFSEQWVTSTRERVARRKLPR